ncbi:MAG: amidohydrolase family protein [Deltaproteobacteria bacterium]|nr:MAG: amidohydrolase family protein [Deltaproteobacteria bacterium]
MKKRNIFYTLLAITALVAALALPQAQAKAQKKEAPPQVLIKNVNIFDGKSDKLVMGLDVLVEDNKIKRIGKIKASRAEVIDGGGKTLIPGLTDAHVHLMINNAPAVSIYEDPWAYVGAQAVAGARAMLMRGFTTVRDVGGPVGGLKRAIDEGLVEGPRILPSGPFISQTSGHGDLETSAYKLSPYFTGIPDKSALLGWAYVADGVPEVTKAAREVLRTGAAQIKVMAGGGVSSYFDPLDTTQYTLEELKAIVTEAEHWGTYVLVHAYTDAAVRLAIEAGVKCIDHGPFLQEETLKLMAEKGVWLSPQAYLFGMTPEELNIVGTPSESKMRQVNKGSANLLKWAKQYGVKIAWGTDLFGPPAKQAQQPLEFVARAKFFTPVEILKQATSENAELFKLSGLRHPYPEGPLGVIQEGAYADLVIVNGNPLKDITLLADPEKNLQLIMKDGKIYKNTL